MPVFGIVSDVIVVAIVAVIAQIEFSNVAARARALGRARREHVYSFSGIHGYSLLTLPLLVLLTLVGRSPSRIAPSVEPWVVLAFVVLLQLVARSIAYALNEWAASLSDEKPIRDQGPRAWAQGWRNVVDLITGKAFNA